MTQFIPSDRLTHLADAMHRAEQSNGSSVPSNWALTSTGSNFGITWSPQAASGGAVSYGSNAMDVNPTDDGGASTDVSRMDHKHRGVRLISAAGSNSLVGDINFIGGGSVGVTLSGQTIQFSGAGSSGGGGAAGSSALLDAIYGNGADGDVTIAAGTTSLARTMYYNNLIVTGTLDTNGWQVFVKGTISGVGTVSDEIGANGTNGGNGTGAAGGAAGAAGGSAGGNVLGAGSVGIIGRVGGFNAVGLAGSNGQKATMARSDGTTIDYPLTAAGGAGANAGGAGNGLSTPGDNTLQPKPTHFPTCIALRDPNGTQITFASMIGKQPGSGSGGGSATGGGGGSGGSGGSGGAVVLVAKTWSGSFIVRAKGGTGGNGGNGFVTSGNNGGGGGGGGGAGGYICAIYASRSGWSGTVTAPGGTGGTGGTGNGGGANGGNGTTGPAGIVIEYQMG